MYSSFLLTYELFTLHRRYILNYIQTYEFFD